MAILLQIIDAFKGYGDLNLLDGASAALTDEHKIGLIGKNGAGKSTFCRVILGEEELDHGEVQRHPQLRLGYLTQHDPFQDGESVLEFLLRDSKQPDWKCGEFAGQFEIKGDMLDRPVRELSGGWQTRVKLTSLLLHDPNLLVLDEPTNFLDLRTQLLLEEFLKEFRGACLVVSHDRTFLKKTCSHTLELSRGKLTLFPGDVDAFLLNVEERKEHDERYNAAIASKRRQLEKFIAKNRANANTASQARSKAKQLDSLEFKEIEGAESNVIIRIPEIEGRRGLALRCEDLHIGYPDFSVADNIQVEIEHGTRTAVVGDNGQGKTTFLRSITDSLETLGGKYRWGHGCEIGTYAQHVYTDMPHGSTVQEYLLHEAAPGTNFQSVLNMAGCFLFRGPDVDKKIEVLSGGERARLCLAGLLLAKHNVLVLDEPVNHLDVETVDSLAEALQKYPGTVIFTSHDRHFLSRTATDIVEVHEGGIRHYSGSYEDYLYRVNKEISDGLRSTQVSKGDKKTQEKKKESALSKADKKALARRKYDLERDLKSAEKKSARWDQKVMDLTEKIQRMTNPKDIQKLSDERDDAVAKKETAEEEWFNLQEQWEKEGFTEE